MFYLIRGNYDGLVCKEFEKESDAISAMLRDVADKVDYDGVDKSNGSLDISRDAAYQFYGAGSNEWLIIEGK